MTTRDDIRIQVLEEFAEAAEWRWVGTKWDVECSKWINYAIASWCPRKYGTVPFAALAKQRVPQSRRI